MKDVKIMNRMTKGDKALEITFYVMRFMIFTSFILLSPPYHRLQKD